MNSSWRSPGMPSAPAFVPKALILREQYALPLDTEDRMSKHVAVGVCAGVISFGLIVALAASAPAVSGRVQAYSGPRQVTRGILVEAAQKTWCGEASLADDTSGACVMTANGLVADLRVDTGDFVKLMDVARGEERTRKPGRNDQPQPRRSLLCGQVICAPMFASAD